MRALDVLRTVFHKRDRRGQRNGAIARGARHLAGVIVPAVTGRPKNVAVRALPANLELALGARAVRKREVRRDGLSRIARRIADGDLLSGIVEHLLHAGLIPSHLNRLVGLVILGLLAVTRQLKHHIGAAQTVDVIAGVIVGVDVEERYIAIGLILSVGNADRSLGILGLKGNAALGDLDVDIGEAQIGKLRLQCIIDVSALGVVVNNNLLVGIVELLGRSLERTRGNNLVGGDKLDRRATARSDSLQVLTGSGGRDRCRGARHVGQQRPVTRGSLRVVSRVPRNRRLVGDVDAVGGRTVSTLGLHRRLDAVARNEMDRVTIDLRVGDYAQQVVLPRRGNAVGGNPLNGIVERARRDLDLLADKRGRDGQAAIGLIDAIGELGPIGTVLARVPRHGEVGIIGHVLGQARPASRHLHARRDL